MALPNFLIIGAMKSATSSLRNGLGAHPDVFFPAIKEPDALADPDVLTPAGRRRYEDLYAGARPGALLGDGSTSYSKLPKHPGVPERALELLGPDLRIIYSVREPLARARSHHHHLLIRNLAPKSFEDALEAQPGIRDYGCYANQLQAWLDVFPLSQIKIVYFEQFKDDPAAVLRDVTAFLGLPETSIDAGGAHNVSAQVRPPMGLGLKASQSPLYRRLVRPMLPASMRKRLVTLSNPHADDVPDPPRPATRAALLDFYRKDSERFAAMTGAVSPIWPSDS
jgi:sulfotransferase family protein